MDNFDTDTIQAISSQLIPRKARLGIYLGTFVVLAVITAVLAGLSSAGWAVPSFLIFLMGFATSISGPALVLAALNATPDNATVVLPTQAQQTFDIDNASATIDSVENEDIPVGDTEEGEVA